MHWASAERRDLARESSSHGKYGIRTFRCKNRLARANMACCSRFCAADVTPSTMGGMDSILRASCSNREKRASKSFLAWNALACNT